MYCVYFLLYTLGTFCCKLTIYMYLYYHGAVKLQTHLTKYFTIILITFTVP